jgi:hypothetical protein
MDKSENSIIQKCLIMCSFSLKCKGDWKKGSNSLKTKVKEQQYKSVLRKSREGCAESCLEFIDLRDSSGK